MCHTAYTPNIMVWRGIMYRQMIALVPISGSLTKEPSVKQVIFCCNSDTAVVCPQCDFTTVLYPSIRRATSSQQRGICKSLLLTSSFFSFPWDIGGSSSDVTDIGNYSRTTRKYLRVSVRCGARCLASNSSDEHYCSHQQYFSPFSGLYMASLCGHIHYIISSCLLHIFHLSFYSFVYICDLHWSSDFHMVTYIA